MLGHKRIPSREGGVEIVVEELSTRMVKLGHQVTCFNRRGHHVSGKEFDGTNYHEYKGVKIKNVITINGKGLAAISSSFFAALAAAFGKYDIVHFHAEGPCIMMWLPKFFGKRCIATIHGLDHQRSKWGTLARKVIILGEKTAVKYADEIIVLSRETQNYFDQIYGRKTQFIPNGVNAPVVKEADEIKSKFGLEKGNYILFLGRIVPEKGIHYMINAFKKVKTEKKLVIAGGSSDTQAYEEEIKKQAEGDARIIFTGFVQGRMLEELYSNAYIYILPSDLEGMPLSLLEAMSYGNCCLISDIEECASVVGDNAMLFHRGNSEDLQKNMQTLCDHPEIVEKYRAEAGKFITKNYDWSKVVDQTLQLYRGQ